MTQVAPNVADESTEFFKTSESTNQATQRDFKEEYNPHVLLLYASQDMKKTKRKAMCLPGNKIGRREENMKRMFKKYNGMF
jgi:hypothetical protein